ncbi:hypothetical protein DPMN_005350 [Dreissena polymorpha]|uniref:Uncharacterized protein n=1 Tax=Dreissena polymorpha TaxID=45954 RepID=A0A9D4MTD0_DREPO|nr:hypothetical protein DPMN_005350 [Dreissena polymorpha]
MVFGTIFECLGVYRRSLAPSSSVWEFTDVLRQCLRLSGSSQTVFGTVCDSVGVHRLFGTVFESWEFTNRLWHFCDCLGVLIWEDGSIRDGLYCCHTWSTDSRIYAWVVGVCP